MDILLPLVCVRCLLLNILLLLVCFEFNHPSIYVRCIHCERRFAADGRRHETSTLYAHLRSCMFLIQRQ
ncbi:hypothetical protein MKW94_004712 [Papaver nudicaule]|uniref:BED-type domain-containing protein n=1 Tax=Papaver nudicaule TaxID=74823 RepID=A0AA42AXH4_PAPNU|nr:hypothetical protein [Papaver nudicaule]